MNEIIWRRMNRFGCKSAQMINGCQLGKETKRSTLWSEGQRSKSRYCDVRVKASRKHRSRHIRLSRFSTFLFDFILKSQSFSLGLTLVHKYARLITQLWRVAFYLRQCGGCAAIAVCQSVIHSLCHSVCRITAKLISRFHWNLALWLDLPSGRTD